MQRKNKKEQDENLSRADGPRRGAARLQRGGGAGEEVGVDQRRVEVDEERGQADVGRGEKYRSEGRLLVRVDRQQDKEVLQGVRRVPGRRERDRHLQERLLRR